MQIKVKELTHIFNLNGPLEYTAIKDVSVGCEQGEFITIVGETGSGKTTFIEHLNALLRPTSGEVHLDDFKIIAGKRKIRKINNVRKRVGVVFQFAEYQLFEETILKDIIFGPINMGTSKEEAIKRAEKYLKLVGLPKSYLERSPFALSGGQKRRVAIAGILAMEPDVLVFDEPTAGLDPAGEKDMYRIFNKLHAKGKTIIIVTHNLDHVLEYSYRTLAFKEAELMVDKDSIDLMYDKRLLKKMNLRSPKLASLVWDLEKKGLQIGKVRSIEDLAAKI